MPALICVEVLLLLLPPLAFHVYAWKSVQVPEQKSATNINDCRWKFQFSFESSGPASKASVHVTTAFLKNTLAAKYAVPYTLVRHSLVII